MALQIRFFMNGEDELALFRALESKELELWPALSEPGYAAPLITESLAKELDQPAYYFAAGDVEGYPLKRGKDKGLWKIDEVLSPVIFFSRSLPGTGPDDEGELRSGYFWAETEPSGDYARTGGKPVKFLRAVRELHEYVKARYRKSSPVKGLIYYVGPACAREGLPLREEGRKGERVTVYR